MIKERYPLFNEIPSDGGGGAPAATPSGQAAETGRMADSSPAPNSETPPATAPNTPATPAPVSDVAPNVGEPGFQVPDAYKDAPWAAKVKSPEDLWKQLENTNKLIGSKRAAPGADATPEQLEEFYAASRPADVKEYGFMDAEVTGVSEGYKDNVAKMLSKNGLTAKQGQDLWNDFKALEDGEYSASTTKEGWATETKNRFADKSDEVVGRVSHDIKTLLSPEDAKAVDTLPNKYLGLVYQAMEAKNKVHDAELADIKKKYGIADEIDKGGKGATVTADNIDTQIQKVRDDILGLSARPHSVEERANLQKQLDGLYDKKVKLQPKGN